MHSPIESGVTIEAFHPFLGDRGRNGLLQPETKHKHHEHTDQQIQSKTLHSGIRGGKPRPQVFQSQSGSNGQSRGGGALRLQGYCDLGPVERKNTVNNQDKTQSERKAYLSGFYAGLVMDYNNTFSTEKEMSEYRKGYMAGAEKSRLFGGN